MVLVFVKKKTKEKNFFFFLLGVGVWTVNLNWKCSGECAKIVDQIPKISVNVIAFIIKTVYRKDIVFSSVKYLCERNCNELKLVSQKH